MNLFGSPMMSVILGFIGIAIILYAYWKNARGDWLVTTEEYLVLNAVGSLVLAMVALAEAQWHFFAGNLVWMGIAVRKLWRTL